MTHPPFTLESTCLLHYTKNPRQQAGANAIPHIIPPGGYPLILVFATTWKLIYPLKLRAPMWISILKVFTTPFNSPTFFETYIGDIFTSLVKVFVDLTWT